MIAVARVLKSRGYSVEVAAPAFANSEMFVEALTASNVPFRNFVPPPIFTNWRHRHVALANAELWQRHVFARFCPDLVHVLFSWTDQGLDNLWLAGRCRIPSMVSVHTCFPEPNFLPWHRKQLTKAFQSLVGIYGVSASSLNRFLEIYEPYLPLEIPKSVIHNFVDTNRFRPSHIRKTELSNELGIGEDCLILGAVGRLDDQKKPLSLISVFSRIREALPQAHLLMVGEGPLAGELRRCIAELGCEDAVTLMGFRPDIEQLYAAMDLHLLFSRNEGFAAVTAEAMASGALVVQTRVPGTEEVIGDCPAGRLVATGDEAEAANAALEFLLLAPERRAALALMGRRHVEENFSFPKWCDKVVAFYADVLNRKTMPCGSA